MVFALPYTTLLWMLLNIMRTKRKSLFGWSNVFYNYSLLDFAKDAWMPFLIALVLLAVAMLNNTDMYVQVGKILDLGISIIPSMVALIVAAYTIMLSFILSDKVTSIKNKEGGADFIQSINSGFAFCLLISILTIIMMVLAKGICNMQVEVEPTLADIINYVVYFLFSFLLVYSVFILIGIVIDIYNSGQTACKRPKTDLVI